MPFSRIKIPMILNWNKPKTPSIPPIESKKPIKTPSRSLEIDVKVKV